MQVASHGAEKASTLTYIRARVFASVVAIASRGQCAKLKYDLAAF
jgi:hypothetical protein